MASFPLAVIGRGSEGNIVAPSAIQSVLNDAPSAGFSAGVERRRLERYKGAPCGNVETGCSSGKWSNNIFLEPLAMVYPRLSSGGSYNMDTAPIKAHNNCRTWPHSAAEPRTSESVGEYTSLTVVE